MATNFQKHLDSIYENRSEIWKNKVTSLDFMGELDVADVKMFLDASTDKNLAGWAVSVELKTRHSALKKIVDSF